MAEPSLRHSHAFCHVVLLLRAADVGRTNHIDALLVPMVTTFSSGSPWRERPRVTDRTRTCITL